MLRRQSIAGKLAIMFGLAIAVASIIAGIALYAFQAKQMQHHKLQELSGRFVIVERLAQHNDSPQRWVHFSEKLRDFTPQDGNLYFLVQSANPDFVIGSNVLNSARWEGPVQGYGKAYWRGKTYLTKARNIAANKGRPAIRLIIAICYSDVQRAQRTLAMGIAIISLLTLVLVSAMGWWIARVGLAPVDKLSDHALTLGSDPALRLPSLALPVELQGMVRAFNGALDRLQSSYIKLSTFNADVAHELRTPLGNLIGETQVALARPRSAEDLEAVLSSNLEELERLKSIINDMLFLARADEGNLASNLISLSLAEQVHASAEFMEMVMEEAGISISVEGDAKIWADKSLLGIAITNLLDNAVRHGQPDSEIEVTITSDAMMSYVAIWNPCAPIAEEALARLFDRFYRPDPARANSRHSHGLGLAIVRAVARMHGGDTLASYRNSGLCIQLTLAQGSRKDSL